MDNATFFNATGNIDYNMTNDYMFKVIFQENETALRGLLCSLLRLHGEDIRSVEILNPIKLGESIDKKDFYLDINLMLNDNTIINLEMQVVNEYNWPDRSLNYICRSFLSLSKGDDYNETKPAIHIGFLDYTLFPEHPEFYATYKLTNIRTHQIFNDKFTIGVVDLGRTDLATDEDHFYGLDKWVKIFKAKTWEELKMIAENKPELLEASKSLYEFNADWEVRQRCIVQEEELARARRIEKLERENERLKQLELENERLKQLELENERLKQLLADNGIALS